MQSNTLAMDMINNPTPKLNYRATVRNPGGPQRNQNTSSTGASTWNSMKGLVVHTTVNKYSGLPHKEAQIATNKKPKLGKPKSPEEKSPIKRINRAFSSINNEENKHKNINQSMRLYEIKHFDLPEGYQDMNVNFSSTVSQELPHIKNEWIKEKWFVSLND